MKEVGFIGLGNCPRCGQYNLPDHVCFPMSMTCTADPKTKDYKVPKFDPEKCAYCEIVDRTRGIDLNYDGSAHRRYWPRRQCSRKKGYGLNKEYCKQHAKLIEKVFGRIA